MHCPSRRRFLDSALATSVVAGLGALAGVGPLFAAPAASAPAAPSPGAGAGDDMIARLQQLAALKQSGVLTDEEFTAAKAKLLG